MFGEIEQSSLFLKHWSCVHLSLTTSSIRVLVADNFEPWRRFISSTLQKQPEYQVICEVSDGVEAVQKAHELQPDLILLDIGLPSLNGIEAARRIREHAPKSKIVFFSGERSVEFAEYALRTGSGYVIKSNARRELLPAVAAVLQGKHFVSTLVPQRKKIVPLQKEG